MKEKIWYPSLDYIDQKHHDVIEQNPSKYPGVKTSVVLLDEILREARNTPGMYKKAAFLLKGIKDKHVFEDGNTTTAILLTIDFLEKNDKEFKPEDQKLIAKVGDNHGAFSREEIARFLETGEIDETKLP